MRKALVRVGSQWWVLKLAGMSTVMREWAAIHCLAHMPFRDVLLRAKVGACAAPQFQGSLGLAQPLLLARQAAGRLLRGAWWLPMHRTC
jgi:hypothetical protein